MSKYDPTQEELTELGFDNLEYVFRLKINCWFIEKWYDARRNPASWFLMYGHMEDRLLGDEITITSKSNLLTLIKILNDE